MSPTGDCSRQTLPNRADDLGNLLVLVLSASPEKARFASNTIDAMIMPQT